MIIGILPLQPCKRDADNIIVKGSGIARVYLTIALLGLFLAGLAVGGNRLWASTEARSYIVLGAAIADHFDFSHDLFLLRTPGYPFLLAVVFRIAGSLSPFAILTVQSLMVAAVALLTTAAAWTASSRRDVALVSGLLCLANLQLWGLANMLMSEVPFSLCVAAAALCLIRYVRSRQRSSMFWASFWIGVSYLFRPIGLVMLAPCLLAAWAYGRGGAGPANTPCSALRISPAHRNHNRRIAAKLWIAAIAPTAAMVAGWNLTLHTQGRVASGSVGPALYHRTAELDRLDSSQSSALLQTKQVVADAVRQGLIAADSDHREGNTVIAAGRVTGSFNYSESCVLLKQAGIDLILEHFPRFLFNTIRYTVWTLVEPDSSYRYVIGGAPGKLVGLRTWIRDPAAELFASDVYQPMIAQFLDPNRCYLPLHFAPGPTTSLWKFLVLAHHRFFQFRLGGKTLYFWMISGCLVGMVVAGRDRGFRGALLLAGIALLQVAGSAFLVGSVPRYAAPVQPLLHIFGAFFLCKVFDWVRIPILRRCRRAATDVHGVAEDGSGVTIST